MQKHIIVTSFVLLTASIGYGVEVPAWYRRGAVQYEKRLKLTIQNPLAEARIEEPVVLRLDEILKQAPDFSAASFTLVDPATTPESPCHIEEGGNDVPCEAENTEGDGAPDELVFLATLQPKESKIYHLYYTPVGGPATPVYSKRTQITEFKDDPNALFAIESDVLMFRFGHGDGKPLGLVGDIFGKFKERPAYVQHLYHQVINGLQTDTPAGRWLFYPLNQSGQLGLGNLVAVKGDQVFRPDASAKLSGKILTDGRLRSRGEITITDWVVDDAVLDVHIIITMYAGQPYAAYELKANAKGNANDLRIGVGMQKLDEQQISGVVEQGYAATWGLRKAGMNGESKATWFAYGHAEAEKWGEKEGILDLGLALVFRPEDAAEIQQSDAGGLLLLKGTPSEAQPLKTRLVLSGGWKRGGYVGDAQAFFAMQQALSRRLRTPLRVEIAGTESAPAHAARKSLAKTTFFLSNPSCTDITPPAEIDLNAFGLEAKEGVVCADKNVSTDTVKIGGQTRVFVQAPVAALKTRSVPLASGKVSVSPSFKITEEKAEGGKCKAVKVETGEATWLITTNGLAHATWKGKELALQHPGLTGEVQTVYNGSAVAIVCVGDGESAVDYCFFRGLPAVKVLSSRAIDLQSAGGYSSYVAKKEITVVCGSVEACSWGRVTSDRFPRRRGFGGDGAIGDMKTDVCYPAEWAALVSTQQQAAVMAYGDPSTGPIIVDKGGLLHVDAPKAGEQRSMTLCLIERPEEGEGAFPRLCQPIVSIAHEKGFLSQAYRDGNNVPDAVFVEDRNGNQMPDFAGDRWSFDLNSDDALESILEFESPPDKPDRAVKMKVYCDTATGQTELHANSFLGRFGVDRPYPDVSGSAVITNTCFYDGCLGPGETNRPFFVYEDWDNDGLFFKGPVTEGGFVSGDRILSAYGGPAWWAGSSLTKDWLLECWDLDRDGDNDVWLAKFVKPPAGFFGVKAGEDMLHWSNFDLSDNNQEPVTMVDVSRGRAGWAVRFNSFIDSDNSKIYCEGFERERECFPGLDWPGASGWDIDNDGVSEGNVYICNRHRMFTLDLLNAVNEDDPYVGQKLWLEKDMLYAHPTRHENFCLFLEEGHPGEFSREYVEQRFPGMMIKDTLGHSMSFHGRGIPDGWQGEARKCKEWPNGVYDYTPSNGWDSCLIPTPIVTCLHWLRPLWRTAHESQWGMLQIRADARLESNPEGQVSPDYYFYFSPVVNDYHLKGLQFGVQAMRLENRDPEAIATWQNYDKAYWKAPPMQAMKEYDNPQRYLNDYSRLARKSGIIFLYYSDEDGDGYVDSYVLDNEHDGTFEKRAWLDKKAGTLAVYDKAQLAITPNTLKMPEFQFLLKNYTPMVDLYRATSNAVPLLWTWAIQDGRLTPHDAPSFILSADWLPKVAVDVAHRRNTADPANNLTLLESVDVAHDKNSADPWKDYEPQGLDTLARIISQQMAEPVVLKTPWSAQSLAGLDILVAWNLARAPSAEELAALDAFLQVGGALILMAGPEASEASDRVTSDLASRFGVQMADKAAINVTPSLKLEQLEAMFKEARDDESTKLLAGVRHPLFLEGKGLKAGEKAKALLQYAGQQIISETAVGKGKVVVMNSDLLLNKFMCLEFDLRVHPFKPGNQQVAWNLMQSLLGSRKLQVKQVAADATKARLIVQGKGGKVTLKVPWTNVSVSVNGKAEKAEHVGDTVSVMLPAGQVELKVEGAAKGN